MLLFLAASFAVASLASGWAEREELHEGETGLSVLNIDPTPNWEVGDKEGAWVRLAGPETVLWWLLLLKLI